MPNLNKQVVKATKWSAFTEIIAKLITPITSMVLARLLTPEAFGVVTTITMIISFAEIFTDAGFQKYIVQHDFKNELDLKKSTNVAFWSNFVMSMLIWFIIAIFSSQLAAVVGSPGLGNVLVIACVTIPLAAFSSIQMALFRRALNFKTLFKVRMVSITVPLVVTIPFAFWLRSYWALILGYIAQNFANAVLLTFFSKWKPQLFFSFGKLKEMMSFTIWSIFEHISIWLTVYVDVFIVGTMLNQHYLGLYKTSSAFVGQLMGIITAATTPVLFSSLSRLQNNDKEFKLLFFKFQKLIGIFIFPLGVGIYCFSDFLTIMVLGEKWVEASPFIGLWGLTSSITIVFSNYASEVYRSKGRPKLSVLAQWLHIIVLWPVVLWSINYGFEVLYTARAWVRLEGVVVNLVILYFLVGFTPMKMIKNVFPSLIASIIMMIVAFLLKICYDSIAWTIISVVLCSMSYIVVIGLFPNERKLFRSFILKKERIMI